MKLLKGIKNIIFDLGGVLLNLDPQKTIHAFSELGMPQLIHAKTLTYANDVFYQMEQGFISPEEFRTGINKLLPQQVNDESIDRAWTAMMLDFPKERVKILRNLAPHYNLYLFSNTNAIHVEWFEKKFYMEHGFHIQELFQKVFYSNEIGYRKPNLDAFQEIISRAKIKPEESMFIDDLEANVDGAKKAGMQAYWLKPDDVFDEIFAEYLL